MRTRSLGLVGIALAMLAEPARAIEGDLTARAIDRLKELLPQSLAKLTEPLDPRVISQDDPSAPAVSLRRVDDAAALEQRLRQVIRPPYTNVRLRVVDGEAHVGNFSVGSGETIEGNVLVVAGRAEVFGRVNGNVVSLDSDILVHRGAVLDGDAVAFGGRVRNLGGTIGGETRSVGRQAPVEAAPVSTPRRIFTALAGVAGSFLTLTVLGFLLILFGKSHLEVVSDTASHSFLRSFMVGLVSQVLLVPTFGMLVVGLALSVVGVLLIPFVVAVYLLLAVAAVLGGFLAVAHAMGEARTRRQLARGVALSPNSFRYVTLGLVALTSVWLVWALFGWVPVAGTLILAAAVLASWVLGTVGLGACVLSRGGVRPSFAGRYLPPEMMTDEYLWATPQHGVPAVKRPTRP